jgi:hypothetical protein
LAQSAIIANGKSTVSNGEAIFVGTTLSVNTNNVTLTTSANNQPADVVTVYSSQGTTYVSAIDQTVRQTVINQTGVYEIVAGNGITISSTSAGGTGEVTINTTAGNIAVVNLDGNISNVLRGDGSWSADANSAYGNSNVVSLLGAFGSNTIVTTGNASVGNIIGNGQALTGIAGANVSGFVANANVANTAFSVAAANVSGLGNIATINLDGNVSNLLTGNGTYVAIPVVPAVGNIATINLDGNSQTWLAGNGVFANIAIPTVGNIATINLDGNVSNVLRGNGSWGADANSSYGDSNVVSLLNSFGSNTITTTGNVSVGNIIGNGQALTGLTGANVTGAVGLATYATTANAVAGGNVSGAVGLATYATTANSVAVANVSGIGNIATINLDGNVSNVLRGNGSWGADANSSYGDSNVVSLLGAFGSNTIVTTGSVTAANITLPNSSVLTFGDTPVTNRYYVDATRTDTYTQNGSQARPFKTIAGAQAAIATAISGGLNPEVEPIYLILLSNITENVSLTVNHVYLIGQSGQIHQPIILSGNVTVNPTSGTLNNNHFSITGLEIVGGTNGKAIYVTGTSPLRLSLQDVWITANGTGAGLYQDNSGTGTYTHGGPLKVSHNGSGDVYCFNILNGTASFESVETSGATQVGAAGPGATLTFNNSQLDANGDVVVETYGNGILVVTNSVIKNSQANGFGIKLNAVANVAGTVSVGQSAFNVPAGTGQAVWLDPNTTVGLSGVFAWGGVSFYPSTNTTINPSIIPGPLATLVGTIASPILYGDITSYAVAQDWDLLDNNASALSFDTTGKTGIINIVTTNSSEGVTMSGYANVTGNITGGNVITAGVVKSGAFVTGNIPAAATAGAGSRAFVTDATLATFGSLYVGGAANAVPVYSDGSAWFIG